MTKCINCGSVSLVSTDYCARCLLIPLAEEEPIADVGREIGMFDVVEHLGAGGFAEVYSAINRNRPNEPPVAIKIMRLGLNTAEFLARFEQEHHVLRRLRDPGIVRVFESGVTEDGRPYFVMEQIDGLRITEYCEANSLSLDSRIELFVRVCRAVHHAHQKGIVHRDLKPANILVSNQDDVPVPCVIDFGLAKAVQVMGDSSNGSDEWVTSLGVAMGTPGYISPEQADGSDETDTLSDSFSLGVILYELVARRPPWAHDTWKKIPHSKWSSFQRENLPLRPSEWKPLHSAGKLDDDLDTICMKAISVDRDQRYESVAQFAEDLSYWLRGDPILAKPPSLAYRLSKLALRYRWQAASLAIAFLGFFVAAVSGIALAIRERQYSSMIVDEHNVSQHSAYASSINLATYQIMNGEPYIAKKTLEDASEHLRGWEWNYLWSAIPKPLARVESGLENPIAFNLSNNKSFAAACNLQKIVVVNLMSQKIERLIPVDHKVYDLAVGDDGDLVAITGGTKCTVYQGAEVKWSVDVAKQTSIAWAPNGNLIVAEGNASKPETFRVSKFERNSGRVIASSSVKRWKLSSKKIVVGRTRVVLQCSFDRLAVFNLSDMSLAGYVYRNENTQVNSFAFNDDESRVVIGQGNVVAESSWQQAIGEESISESPYRDLFTVDGNIQRLNKTRDCEWMAITDTSYTVNGKETKPIAAITESMVEPTFDGNFATISRLGEILIREEQTNPLESMPGIAMPSGPEGRRVAISPDSRFCVFQTWSRENVFRYDIQRKEVDHFETPVRSDQEKSRLPEFHPDGKLIIAFEDGASSVSAIEWALKKREPLPVKSQPWSATTSPSGKLLFVGTHDGVSVVDWSTKELVQEWSIAGGPFVVMPKSDNSGVFAVGVDELVHEMRVGSDQVRSSRLKEDISPSRSDYFAKGQILATSSDGGVSFYALGAQHKKIAHVYVEAPVSSLRFSRDGSRIAIALNTRSIEVWDWRWNHRLIELPTRGKCSSMDFSDDGKWFVNTDFNPSAMLR